MGDDHSGESDRFYVETPFQRVGIFKHLYTPLERGDPEENRKRD